MFGGLGYLLGVRRYGPLPMIGVLAGAVAAGYLARWIGEQSGAPASLTCWPPFPPAPTFMTR